VVLAIGAAQAASPLPPGAEKGILSQAAPNADGLRLLPPGEARLAKASGTSESSSLVRQVPDEVRGRDPGILADATAASAEARTADIKVRLATRYGNPAVTRLLTGLSEERALAVYSETSRLIDSRHIEPATYEVRAKRALDNLSVAMENPAFLRANRIAPTPAQIKKFRDSLAWLSTNRPAGSAKDATNTLHWTIDIAKRTVGLPATAVVLEFIYAGPESLDKYSAFEPAADQAAPSAGLEDLQGEIVGIGVEIKPHDGGVQVVRTLRGGPAAEAGLKPGDVIVKINGNQLKGQSLDFAVDQIKGGSGTALTMSVSRDGSEPSAVRITRRRVAVYSLSEVRMLEPTVGYIKLDKFTATSSAEMDEALWKLYGEGMDSLIIDLRGNPGGLLTTAIELSDKFLPCGTIVSTRGRTSADQSMEYASYDRTWKLPLVVLVDENSASASEIFAAAISENERGLIVGRRSYGKGTVQTHFPLNSMSGNLRLTTAKFYSPKGRAIAGEGVEPSVKVDFKYDPTEITPPANDRDIAEAINVAKGEQVRVLANSKSGCGRHAS
jgi:carboxyl-terminal processing protease